MTNADFRYPTILVIGIEVPVTASGPNLAEKQRQQTAAELALVQEVLLESGLCQQTRITNNGLVGLFPGVEAAFDIACALLQTWVERNQGSTPTGLRILVDRLAAQAASDTGPKGRENAGGEQLLEQLPPGQIFATSTIVRRLSEVSRARFQVFEHGTEEETELYQVICNEETITRIAIPTLNKGKTMGTRCLCLRWRDNTVTLLPESPTVTMGRDDQSDVCIDSDLASRIHAQLSFQETNFVLTDHSTNGTFVQIDADAEICLHNEQIVLRGSGVISLGRCIRGGHGKLVYFKLTK